MGVWTYAQIVARACSAAKVPGQTAAAGLHLISALDELCQDWDFDQARGYFQFNFNQSTVSNQPNGQLIFGGPYLLPGDFLRLPKPKSAWWSFQGVPYPMIPIDLDEFDMTVQQAGNSSYPYFAATDVSQSPAQLFVYPQPSGNYPVNMRYQRAMPVSANPATDNTIPWFPNTDYLFTKTAGELMKQTGDSRADAFLGGWDEDGPNQFGAGAILRRYMKKKGDDSNRAMIVEKDRRRFSNPSFVNLPNSKTVGW